MKKTVESRLGLSEAVVFCVEGGLVELMLLLLMMMRRENRYPEGRVSLPFIGGFPPSACPALLLKCRAVRDSLSDRNSSPLLTHAPLQLLQVTRRGNRIEAVQCAARRSH